MTYKSAAAQGLRIDLQRWDGSNWLMQAETTTAANGSYVFTGAPALAVGEIYAVRYLNDPADPNPGPGYLWSWWGNRLAAYTPGTAAWGGDFDVADIPLVSPADGAAVTLPAQFCWTPRGLPGDTYRLALYNWLTDETAWTAYFGNVSCANLTGIQIDWPSGETYAWWVEVGRGADPGANPYNLGSSQDSRPIIVNTAVESQMPLRPASEGRANDLRSPGSAQPWPDLRPLHR